MEISGLCDPGAYPISDTHTFLDGKCGICRLEETSRDHPVRSKGDKCTATG
jgi:hypothetical protein